MVSFSDSPALVLEKKSKPAMVTSVKQKKGRRLFTEMKLFICIELAPFHYSNTPSLQYPILLPNKQHSHQIIRELIDQEYQSSAKYPAHDNNNGNLRGQKPGDG